MIKAVVDANVFVSAILSPKGSPAKVLAAWRNEEFQLLVSEAILEEIYRVLQYPKIARRHGWSEDGLLAFMDDLAHLTILTPGELRLQVIAEDPPDNRYLECAVEGAAEYIVSGDQHLLALGTYKDIEILTPRRFLQAFRKTSSA